MSQIVLLMERVIDQPVDWKLSITLHLYLVSSTLSINEVTDDAFGAIRYLLKFHRCYFLLTNDFVWNFAQGPDIWRTRWTLLYFVIKNLVALTWHSLTCLKWYSAQLLRYLASINLKVKTRRRVPLILLNLSAVSSFDSLGDSRVYQTTYWR